MREFFKKFAKAAAVLVLVAVSAFGQSATKNLSITVLQGAQGPQSPTLFFTDLDSAQNAGGESVSGFAGAYVTIYGNNLGASQGTSTVAWNGQNCLRVVPATGSYTGWGMAHLWYQEIIVQLGAGCTPGSGVLTVTTPGGSSAVPFSVRTSGKIYCISTSGSDSNTGLFPSSCFLTPKFAFTQMAADTAGGNPGDTVYWEGGVTVSSGGSFSALDWGASGTAGNPVAMVTYPGATPQPGVTCNPCTDGYAIRAAQGFPATQQYLTMAGLRISGDTFAWFSEYGGNNQRFAGNFFTCTGNSSAVGCFQTSQQTFIKFYGNEVTGIVAGTQSGGNGTSKQYHDVYFCTDTNHIEEAWNSIHNNLSCNATQFHSSPLGGSTGFDQFDISVHDNLVHDEPCTAFLFATVDASQPGGVNVYNNVIYHVGTGPAPADGEESETCFRFAQIINAGPNPSGVANVFNNTCYDAGSFVGAFGHSGSLGLDSNATANVGVNTYNNIFQQLSGEFFWNSGGGQPSGPGLTLSGIDNIWNGGNQTAPTWTTGNITASPNFLSPSTGNLNLTPGSPAIAAGTATGASAFDFTGYFRPNPPAIGAYEYQATPTLILTAALPLAVPSGSNWGGASPCGTNVNCYHVPLPEASLAGATLIMAFGYDSTSNNQVFSVTDNKSNTWTLDTTSSASNNKTLRMYRATNVAAGTTSITVTLSSGAQNGYWNALVGEYFNVGGLDVSSCNTGTGTSITAGSLTPTTAGDLIFQAKYSAGLASQTGSFTQGSQTGIVWNLASQLLGDGAANQYGVYNATTALNPTFTQAASDTFISCAVALKPVASGGPASAYASVVHQEHDAMPKNASNPWKVGLVVDVPNSAVYLSYVGNDSISSVTSSPSPNVGWTASGADFVGLNGHNHVNSYCASWTTPPGNVVLSINRGGTSNDSINMMYVVKNGTCALDVDSAGQSGSSGTSGSLTVCTNCLTPTKQNDFIVTMGGQAFCTGITGTAPSGVIFDSAWFTGNTIDGPTQTDENNFWSHFYNGSSLSSLTYTFGEACDFTPSDWANRVVAYQTTTSH
jgi:hypothetical protein